MTWHQLRPGEVRHDCGGCHAHSQQPTLFEDTYAARDDYEIWDLTERTPLLTDRPRDESGRKWDTENTTGLRTVAESIVNVEYHRDIRPILERSCVACHTGEKPAGNLNLDADAETVDIVHTAKVPGTYYRLAADERAQFGHKPPTYDSWGYPNASRYVRKFQARRSLLVWKIFGERLDGFSNDDHPSESKPGAGDLVQRDEPVDKERNRARYDIDFVGSVMPPPAAVKAGKVAPLTDEDRRTITRWIDLGCPIDLDYDPDAADGSEERGYGWMLDDNRPILTVTVPQPGVNENVERLLIGLFDYGSGLDEGTLRVTADFDLPGAPAGTDVASKFQPTARGVREWKLAEPLTLAEPGTLTVTVRDRQGNETVVRRTFTAH
jgi:hypothetical protein